MLPDKPTDRHTTVNIGMNKKFSNKVNQKVGTLILVNMLNIKRPEQHFSTQMEFHFLKVECLAILNDTHPKIKI